MKLRFEGFSDDTFGESATGIDHDNCANGKPIVFRVTAGNNGLFVFGVYDCVRHIFPDSLPACWMIGIQQIDEDVPIPDWNIGFENSTSNRYSCGHSPVLLIDAPDDVKIEYVG
jgi:hypothetical protein